uniref:RNA polymerase alpha subunit n=1 Tax=Sargassum fulvellum TaxID=3016 RepID=UPI0021B5C772|nr:RNA polymerase alpha subunit [Sargassum fulvellum]UVW81067.1 RNA polymerase alpha subunit [Sargassum fulvellum]
MEINSKCKCVDLDLLNPNEFYGHFVFTALEKSEGTTLGNVLRRTLLSNLYGFRIVGVRIAGIKSEFASLEGVREDLFEIMLNLKELVILNYNIMDSTCYGRLKAYGPAIITAASLELPNNVKILNPGNHLLTISDKSFIELEIKIEAGKSYVLAKDQKLEGASDFIPIDSSFAPISKVNWYLKSLPHYIEKNNEELHLEIYTNGTLLPHQALLQARTIIGYMLSTIKIMEFPCFESYQKRKIEKKNLTNSQISTEESNYNYKGNGRVKYSSIKNNSSIGDINETIKNPKKLENSSINSLGLSTRIIKALKKVNINFTQDLIQYPLSDLIAIPGLGIKSLEEIKKKLNQFYQLSKTE